ncbi:MAG TPA: copper amine oxidase N-terminal domain-containing protein [Candidatus Cybelea sp.]|jgi:hypothetical protein|nr:copper amine oxidase N-terminal domain-containing protein [Candidatus Cybelea sp.]
MKFSLSSLGLMVAFVLIGASSALAETQATPVAQASPAADFGSPPSGQIPILYNDRHVYTRPDILKQGRVLAALVRGGTILIPLRSMFEQMGATVSYDSGSKTATVSKAGAEVKVTVGKPEVIINGESRPLDVPPIVYHGDVLVPVRVISEGMGAYVQWVPDRRLVVVRYIPATPPPTEAPPPPAPQETVAPPPPPSPTPFPVSIHGYVRSFYFTRQNASNNPGAQFNFSESKYSSAGVNQATWNSAIALGGDYNFPNSGWDIGGTYLYANPINGPCVVPANHIKGAVCVTQVPPNTNPDDTLPGITLSTFYEAYLKYKAYGWDGGLGNLVFTSPWANPADSRLKPAAFEGGYLGYTSPGGLTVQGADMLAYENRTSSNFSRQTLLTSYPLGNNGLASNIIVPGGLGINTNGFAMGKVGYADPSGTGFAANGYFYGVSDLANMWWGDAKYTFPGSLAPFIAVQGGTEQNAGQSFIGKINSQAYGAQIGANVTKNIQITAGYDAIPWKTDTINLPTNVTCNNSNFQITAKATLAYVLPLNAAQCFTNKATGLTQIYYGGWASPYTDNYDSDPLFTTSVSQGMVDRRAGGTSWKVGAQFTSTNNKWVFIATDAWYNYGNALAPESTNIWVLDGRYRFSHYSGKGPYRGLVLRDRYIQRTLTNTFCGAGGTTICAPGAPIGQSEFGGLPLFKYNRAQIEYDF